MNLQLGKDLEAFINSEVSENIAYVDASEWVREAIRDKINNNRHYQETMQALRSDIDKAWLAADEGKTVDFDVDEMMRELDAECIVTK